MVVRLFFFKRYGAHGDLHGVDRRQRKMCIGDRGWRGVTPRRGRWWVIRLFGSNQEMVVTRLPAIRFGLNRYGFEYFFKPDRSSMVSKSIC